MRIRVLRSIGWGLALSIASLFLVMACVASPRKVTHAKWDGKVFSCPSGTWTWASEPEALKGKKNYVYCVPVRELKHK